MRNLKKVVFLLLILISVIPIQAQSKADRIVGYYLIREDKTNRAKSQIQIYKSSDGKYYGKIAWMGVMLYQGRVKVDVNNPSSSLKTRPFFGMIILNSFVYDAGKDEWNNGTVYDPLNGKTYKCFMRFTDPITLKVSGYIGKQWMGLNRSVVWIKEAKLRK